MQRPAHDFSAAARFLLVGPLLIAAEAVIEPWLIQIVRQFRDSLVPEDALPRFRGLIAGAMRWRDSYLVEILLVVLAFGIPLWSATYELSPAGGTWHTYATAGTQEPTIASRWDLYVASPLIRYLWLRWMWRYILWSTFLCRVASLPLKLVPTHPDRAGGLGFLAFGHVKFAVLTFAFSEQVASFIGEQILLEGMPLESFRDEMVGTAVLNLLIFLTPLLAFSPKLITCKRKGLFEYGTLTDRCVDAFHEKWIDGRVGRQEDLLGSSDVQSLADLGISYETVEKMKPVVVGRETVITFLVASLLPFAPLLLAKYPIEKLLKRLLETFL